MKEAVNFLRQLLQERIDECDTLSVSSRASIRLLIMMRMISKTRNSRRGKIRCRRSRTFASTYKECVIMESEGEGNEAMELALVVIAILAIVVIVGWAFLRC